MELYNLKPAEGSVHKEGKRLGRGEGSGKGGTSSKGHKGQQSRSGYKRKKGFEGGQMPLQRRVPKFGFKNVNRKEFAPINLDMLQKLHEDFSTNIIDRDFLIEKGIISKSELYKILGRGELTASLTVKANAFSGTAKQAIENKGGVAEIL
jgi:large subunit ribosomal protein L15